jgi:hypothetical protein
VLRVFSRIQPMPPNVSDLNRGVGRDHLWVYAEEAQAILAEAEAGKTEFPLPKTLTARLARFHLLDNVRGEPDMWRPDQIKRAEFIVQPLGKTATQRTFRLAGNYAMALPDNQRGLEGKLSGEFTLDTRSGKIVRFRAYGEAQAWGRATYTPDPPPGRFPLKFAIVETKDAVSKIVAPQAVSIGEPYQDPTL